jgi:endonuclease/exonuclease/phosphatase family metal-dependent hydrolase
VLTWNVRGAARPDERLLADVLRRAEPDVVALQEVRHGQSRRLARRLGWHHVWAFKHNPWSPLLWWRAEGMAVLAPDPPADVWRACLTPGVHRLSYRRRVVIAATVHHDDDTLRIYDVHLTTDDAAMRIAQAHTITTRMAADRSTPAVIAGDLNAAGERALLDVFATRGMVDPHGAPTSPAWAPYQRIDAVLVPSTATVVDHRTPPGGPPWAVLSDHLPVLVELDL